MSYCPKCGTPAGKHGSYCRGCGQRLNNPQDSSIPRTCEFCKGTGKDPGDGNPIPPPQCRVCNGAKSGYFTEQSRRCDGPCKGNGQIRVAMDIDPIPAYRKCVKCKGWGWVESA